MAQSDVGRFWSGTRGSQYCDNQSALSLAKHQVYLEKSKHTDVRLHLIKEEIEEGRVKVFKVHTLKNPADMLTKPLPKDKFQLCMSLVNLCKLEQVGEQSR